MSDTATDNVVVPLIKATIITEYLDHGLVLVPIPKGTKGPRRKDWQLLKNCISTAAGAKRINGSVGLAHLYSRTCAIDIDNFTKSDTWLNERGINLSALLMADDAVQIDSGRPNRAKLVYALPVGVNSLFTYQIGGFIEFRCAAKTGNTVQDVLPPTIHPDTGKAYRWKGDWRHLPTLPPELLELWLSLDSVEKPATESGEAIAEGSRNLELFRMASSLRAKGKKTKAITTALLEMNRMRCSPPLSVDEVQRIANNVSKYEPGQARIKYIWKDWVKSESGPASSVTRHVLMSLSEYMDSNGGSCYPTIETLALETAMSVSAIKKHLALAVKSGWVFRYVHMGKGQAWRNYGYIANPKAAIGGL